MVPVYQYTEYKHVPYSGKPVWWGECLTNLLFSSVWQKKVWRMNSSAKWLLIVTTNLDGFSLANRRRFAKFAKLSTHLTFPLYGIITMPNRNYTTVCILSPCNKVICSLSFREHCTIISAPCIYSS